MFVWRTWESTYIDWYTSSALLLHLHQSAILHKPLNRKQLTHIIFYRTRPMSSIESCLPWKTRIIVWKFILLDLLNYLILFFLDMCTRFCIKLCRQRRTFRLPTQAIFIWFTMYQMVCSRNCVGIRIYAQFKFYS